MYNTLHTLCDITQRVSNHYTVKGQFFAFKLEKNYTGQKKFTQTPSVASVTNMRYASAFDCKVNAFFRVFVKSNSKSGRIFEKELKSGFLSGFILIKFLFLSMQMQRCELR